MFLDSIMLLLPNAISWAPAFFTAPTGRHSPTKGTQDSRYLSNGARDLRAGSRTQMFSAWAFSNQPATISDSHGHGNLSAMPA